MPIHQKKTLTEKEAVRVVARLFALYGIDHSPDRDRTRDGDRFQTALFYAARDGLLRLPNKLGAPSKWKGRLGLDLVEDVAGQRMRHGPIISKKHNRIRPLSVSKAIKALREKYPDKWGSYTSDELEKKFYEARKIWNWVRRLQLHFDPLHSDHPEKS